MCARASKATMPRSPPDPDTGIYRSRDQGRLCARWRRTCAHAGGLHIEEAPETAVTVDWDRTKESATASHEGGRVFTVASGVTSMWLFPDRRAVKFEPAAWGS